METFIHRNNEGGEPFNSFSELGIWKNHQAAT